MIPKISNEKEYFIYFKLKKEIEETLENLCKDIPDIMATKLKTNKSKIEAHLKLYDEINNFDRKGDWMFTYNGRRFWPLDPRPEDFDIETIAHALSMLCRFGGHVSEFWSVSDHSILVSEVVPKKFALAGLFHDSSEAYIQDIINPVKTIASIRSAYKPIEHNIMEAISKRFGFKMDEETEYLVKQADLKVLSTEIRDLFPAQICHLKLKYKPLKVKLQNRICSQKESEIKFFNRFKELYGKSF